MKKYENNGKTISASLHLSSSNNMYFHQNNNNNNSSNLYNKPILHSSYSIDKPISSYHLGSAGSKYSEIMNPVSLKPT